MRKLIIMIFLFVIPLSFYAQDRLSGQKGSVVGLKTNIPYWGAMATFNAGVEFRLARHWSLDIETGLNPFDGKKEDGSYGNLLSIGDFIRSCVIGFVKLPTNISLVCMSLTYYIMYRTSKYWVPRMSAIKVGEQE